MKTEEQIRRHLQAVREAHRKCKCRCAVCLRGMNAIAAALQWVLGDIEGENPRLEEDVAKFISEHT